MVIAQGDVIWAQLSDPVGSEIGFDRPVVVLQSNRLNESRLQTVVCVPLTRQLKWAETAGCVKLPAEATGLDQDSVAQCHLISALDHSRFGDAVGQVSEFHLQKILRAVDVVLGR